MLSRCGVQFQRRYGARFKIWHEEEIKPPGVAAVIGSAVHSSVERNLRYKIASGTMIPLEEAEQTARDSFLQRANQGGLHLAGFDKPLDELVGEGEDWSVKLAKLHLLKVAQNVNPLDVEVSGVIVLENMPVDLSYRMDIVEDGRIGDTKTAARKPMATPEESFQFCFYAMAYFVEHEKWPAIFADYLMKYKNPIAKRFEAQTDEKWQIPVKNRVTRAVELIEAVKEGKQAMTPAQPDDWCCTARYCGYHADCPFWSRRIK